MRDPRFQGVKRTVRFFRASSSPSPEDLSYTCCNKLHIAHLRGKQLGIDQLGLTELRRLYKSTPPSQTRLVF